MPKWLPKLSRFGVVGAIVTTINFVLYATLVSLGFHYLIATTLGWVLGVVIAFIGNKHWTFRCADVVSTREAARFLLTYVAQLAIGSSTLVLMIDFAGVDRLVAYMINVAITAAFSFILQSHFVFHARPSVDGGANRTSAV